MTICGGQNSVFFPINTNAFQKLRKYDPDKGWMGYKPPIQLYTDSFIYVYAAILDHGGKNGRKAAQRCRKFHILDSLTADEE